MIENALSAIGITAGVLSVMKLFEAMGLVWNPPIYGVMRFVDLPGDLFLNAFKFFNLALPHWIGAICSFYILMGGYFSWITSRIGKKIIDGAKIEMGSRYVLAVAQEAAIMVVIWPWRLASDCKKRIFFSLTQTYVCKLFLAVAWLLLAAFAFNLVRF